MSEIKPSRAPEVMCLLTFCVVTVVVVDAVVPFGYILIQVLKDSDLSIRGLVFAPIAGLVLSTFINNTLKRGILTMVFVVALVGLWILGLLRFAAYPVFEVPHPSATKILPMITSIPFLVAVIVTITRSLRCALSGGAPQQIVGPERG
jgi:hypothetical protein